MSDTDCPEGSASDDNSAHSGRITPYHTSTPEKLSAGMEAETESLVVNKSEEAGEAKSQNAPEGSTSDGNGAHSGRIAPSPDWSTEKLTAGMEAETGSSSWVLVGHSEKEEDRGAESQYEVAEPFVGNRGGQSDTSSNLIGAPADVSAHHEGNLVDEDIQTPNEADSDVSLSSFLHVCHQTDTETEETQVEPAPFVGNIGGKTDTSSNLIGTPSNVSAHEGNLVDEDIQTPNEADSDVSLSSFLHVCHQTDTETEETQVEPGEDHDGKGQVLNGIEIRHSQSSSPIHYTYKWCSSSKQCFNWKPLSRMEKPLEHIRCHHLNETEKWGECFEDLDTTNAKAVILVNSDDTYQLGKNFDECHCLLPTLLVTHSDGELLMDCLSKCGDVEAKIETELTVLTSIAPDITACSTRVIHTTPETVTTLAQSEHETESKCMPPEHKSLVQVPPDPEETPTQPEHLAQGQSDEEDNGGLIVNGIEIRIRYSPNSLPIYCTYKWCSSSKERFDWTLLSDKEKGPDHIRCHWLNKTEKIDQFIEEVEGTKAKAVILVNCDDTYQLGKNFDGYRCAIPMLLITRFSGEMFQNSFSKTECVEVKIETASRKQELESREVMESGNKVVPTSSKTEAKTSFRKKVISSLQQVFSSSAATPSIELCKEVVKLLYTRSGHQDDCDEKAFVASIVSKFETFELEPVNAKEGKDTLEKLAELFISENTFCQDFPLYFILAANCQCRKKGSLYGREAVSDYVMQCMLSFEEMKVEGIAVVLNHFLSIAADITLGNSNETALSFLQMSTEHFLQKKSKKPTALHDHILWVTIHICVWKERLTENKVTELWKTITSDGRPISEEEARNIKNLVALGQELKLPSSAQFGAERVTHMLVSGSSMPCSFKELRVAVYQLNGVFGTGQQLHTLIEKFRQRIGAAMREVTNDTNVHEGIQLLDTLLRVHNERKWDTSLFHQECDQFLGLLMMFVNWRSSPQLCLRSLLFLESPVVKSHQAFIAHLIETECAKNYSGIVFQEFTRIYAMFDLKQLVNSYLKNYTVPKEMKVSDCTELFTKYVQRHAGAHNHEDLWNFLLLLLKKSDGTKGPIITAVVIALLALDVPGLFDVTCPEDRKAANTIAKNISDVILKSHEKSENRVLMRLEEILSKLSESRIDSTLQRIVTVALLKELFPVNERKEFSFLQEKYMLKGIVHVTKFLMKDMSFDTRPLTLAEMFCFHFIYSCCSFAFGVSDTLEDIPSASFSEEVVEHLGKVYIMSEKVVSNEDTTIPPCGFNIQVECNCLSRYIGWIHTVHKFFRCLKEKFSTDKGNYDELCIYESKRPDIIAFAKSVAAADLVVSAEVLEQKQSCYIQYFRKLNDLLLYVDSTEVTPRVNMFQFLSEYGIELPASLITDVSSYVTVIPPEEQQADCQTYLCSDEFTIQASRDLTLQCLKKLVDDLSGFLNPLFEYLDLLVYFKNNPSALFTSYFDHERQNFSSKEATNIAVVLSNTATFLQQLLLGKIAYSEAKPFIVESDIDEEFLKLEQCVLLNSLEGGAQGCEKLKCMLKLIRFKRVYIQQIVNVCEQYKLNRCLQDKCLIDITDITVALDDEVIDQLTSEEAEKKWQTIRECLQFADQTSLKCLDIFLEVANSEQFLQFLAEKKYIENDDAVETVRNQCLLITTNLQHNEFEELVLNHLIGAINYIAPFLKRGQTFVSLMKAVSSFESGGGSEQLKTVRDNIHMIRLWFSKAEGENVPATLASIMNCGEFVYNLLTKKPSVQVELKLEFSHEEIGQSWGSEDSHDFVRKLGFLSDKNSQSQSKDFMKLAEVAENLKNMFHHLRELGHPDYSSHEFKFVLKCSDEAVIDTANRKEAELQNELSRWKDELKNMQSEHKRLLFFTIPKVLALYEILNVDLANSAMKQRRKKKLTCEIGYLFKRDKKTSVDLQNSVSSVLSKRAIKSQLKPMALVGEFLDDVFNGLETKSILPIHQKPRRDNELFDASNLTQSQLLRLILSVYDGLPDPFQLFRCSSSTQEMDLRIFMKRVILFPGRYLIVFVNYLSYPLQEILVQLFLDLKHKSCGSSLCFVETEPSCFQDIPWLSHKEWKEENLVKSSKVRSSGQIFASVTVVYGMPGSGKTHYIRKCMSNTGCKKLTVAVNESFNISEVISQLSELPLDETFCTVFFNFTFTAVQKQYPSLMKEIRWFFFNFCVLGYVEDPTTGASFTVPSVDLWKVYLEVPSGLHSSPHEALQIFLEDIPALQLVGNEHYIEADIPYDVDDDVQLVCKYLSAYETGCINTTFSAYGRKVAFRTDPNLEHEKCQRLLRKYMGSERKLSQKLFVNYMKRRCLFLDSFPGFNYNDGVSLRSDGTRADTKHLGSTLMETMLHEVKHFCDPTLQRDWSEYLKTHQQIIYDSDSEVYSGISGGTLGLISMTPDDLPSESVQRFRDIGIEIPSLGDLYKRDTLDRYISRALNIKNPNSQNFKLAVFDDNNYVLTLDFALKMLNIHERFMCGVPVIIEGETGVGKTALISMLSKLWNLAWKGRWDLSKDRLILDVIKKKVEELVDSHSSDKIDNFEICLKTLHDLNASTPVSEENLTIVLETIEASSSGFQARMRDSVLKLRGNPIFCMMNIKKEDVDSAFRKVSEPSESLNGLAHLLHIILSAKLRSAFYKINVHAELTADHLHELLLPAFDHAKDIEEAYLTQDMIPYVTVYFDEINTSSCSGLLKEIITDKTFNGKAIRTNIFIIAACNPHRGDSLATHVSRSNASSESWLKGSYYVQPLHPSLRYLMWDYGALNHLQEQQYVNEKMLMSLSGGKHEHEPIHSSALSELILTSQEAMRGYAFEHLKSLKVDSETATVCAQSTVSQRDIQRVFTFFDWLLKVYQKSKRTLENSHRRAVLVALGLVYFMRLNTKYRLLYQTFLDKSQKMEGNIKFHTAFTEDLDWFTDLVDLPAGIAKTSALKENLFAIMACTMTHTPLIIVGEPGSSKTLSFNVAAANLNGQQSKNELFRDAEVFLSIDPHFYQCSQRTTSTEIKKVFLKAMKRQQSLAEIPLPVNCVVFMDEAGLPEEEHESLKVLHYLLDEQEVSFVAISNHNLDAAKTNRAVSLFRPKPTGKELNDLAMASFEQVRHPRKDDLVIQFCSAYESIMKLQEHQKFFGLRDFIYFINFLRHSLRRCNFSFDDSIILHSLERNFNGTASFDKICQRFLAKDTVKDGVQSQSTEVIQQSLNYDTNVKDLSSKQRMCRYKLIIDSSEDNSLMQLLFQHGVLEHDNTDVFICSDFVGESHQRVGIIKEIIHSVAVGHTVVLCQTEEIHQSFYDLFNQQFLLINDPTKGQCYYANIAIGAHTKLCRVDPRFQCVVVLRKSNLQFTPPPFLNRFEKYSLSYQSIFEASLKKTPCLKIVVDVAYKKVKDFADSIRGYLCGYTEETVYSLVLAMLPLPSWTYKQRDLSGILEEEDSALLLILRMLVDFLRENAGFRIPKIHNSELEVEVEHYAEMLERCDPDFKQLKNISLGQVQSLIDEGFFILRTCPHPDVKDGRYPDIYSDTCVVISLLLQWIIGYLSSRLMQLLIPEALAVIPQNIPAFYYRKYLQCHEHFSLKLLIEAHFSKLKESLRNDFVPNKLLCFTRTAPLIISLPVEYPCSTLSKDTKDFLEHYVFPSGQARFAADSTMIFKVTSLSSQSVVEKTLETFVKSMHQLLLLVANMQEVTVNMVNHLRIMIEKAESDTTVEGKLFVVLLHFPPVRLFSKDPCYPSLFSQGWDHYYLDTISSGTLSKDAAISIVVDVKRWFQSFSKKESGDLQLLQTLNTVTCEVIPALSSRLTIVTCTQMIMEESEKVSLLGMLLKGSLGDVLCKMFCTYWTPSIVSAHLQQLARFSYERKSTLNLTDALQSTVRSLFTDFLFITLQNMINCGDMLFILSEKQSHAGELLIELVRLQRLPDFEQLSILSATLQPKQNLKHMRVPKFPLFDYVYGALEELIEAVKTTLACQEHTCDQDIVLPIHSQDASTDQEIVRCLQQLPKHSPKECIEAVITAIEKEADNNEDSIWHRYCTDFLSFKFGFNQDDRLLRIYFNNILQFCNEREDVLEKLVSLHLHVRLHHLDIVKAVSSLKQIQGLLDQSFIEYDPESCESVVAILQSTCDPRTSVDLSAFVIEMLFNGLVNIVSLSRDKSGQGSVQEFSREETSIKSDKEAVSKDFSSWFQCYFSVVSTNSLVRSLFYCLGDVSLEVQLKIAHSTYLVMYSCQYPSEESIAIGKVLFQKLHSQYCNGQKSRWVSPGLKSVASVGCAVIQASNVPAARKMNCYRLFMEGLFSFFLSSCHPCIQNSDKEWFLQFANQNFVERTDTIDTFDFSDLKGVVTDRLLMHHLTEVLQAAKEQRCDNTLALFHSEMRRMVAKCCLEGGISNAKEYIPTFYQLELSPESCLPTVCKGAKDTLETCDMQSRLAHLYFSVVLQRLLVHEKPTVSHLVTLFTELNKTLANGPPDVDEQVLRSIEKQAVAQVLIHQVASQFDSRDPTKVHSLFSRRNLDAVVNVLCDKSTGGSKTDISGHGLVLAMCLQTSMGSSALLLKQLKNHESTLVKRLHLQPLQTLIPEDPKGEVTVHFFPFISSMPGADTSSLKAFYSDIHGVLQKGETLCDQDLICLVERDYKDTIFKLEDDIPIDTQAAFKMLIWLCVYYEFYCHKETSQVHVADVIGKSRQLRNILGNELVGLLQSFIDITCMINVPETATPQNIDAERMRLTEDYRVVPIKVGKTRDPIYEFFKLKQDDPDDVCLRHSLANLVAVVVAIGGPCHLYYHMFEADQLLDTFVTGFMLEGRLVEGRLYDCGVEIDCDGNYGRQEYHDRAQLYNKGAWFLMLWANFGAFCMGAISQPDAQEKLTRVISEWQSARHYCVSQMRSAWLHLGTEMNLTLEQKTFFVTQCLLTLLKIKLRGSDEGLFKSQYELEAYEKSWRDVIYLENSFGLIEKFNEHCQLYNNKLLPVLSVLRRHYPKFPTEVECFSILLSSPKDNQLQILSKFALAYPRLKAGGAVLPDLIEFYTWIHEELAYRVDKTYASNNSLEEILTKACKRYGTEDLFTLFNRVKDGYNKYVETIGGTIGTGACANVRKGKILNIDSETKLLHYLTTSCDDGWLYIVIADIINFQNEFLDEIYAAASNSSIELSFAFSGQTQSCVSPSEVTAGICIVEHEQSAVMTQLVQSRILPVDSDVVKVDFNKLQEDVIRTFIIGKPKLHDPNEHLLKIFKFRIFDTNTATVGISDADLNAVKQHLTGEFKVENADIQHLEVVFHSADYHKLMEVATGLLTSMQHLKSSISSATSESERGSITLLEFLCSVYCSPADSVWDQIGITSLSSEEVSYLSELELRKVYSTLVTFCEWIKDGVYDFCHLPWPMKAHLPAKVLDEVYDIYMQQGNRETLLKEIQDLTSILAHCEPDLMKNLNNHKQKPILRYLVEMKFVSDDAKLPNMIPASVLCEHYKELRISLRRQAEKHMVPSSTTSLKLSAQSQYVGDLWSSKALKHLRDRAEEYLHDAPFEYDPVNERFNYDQQDERFEDESFVFVGSKTEMETEAGSAIPQSELPQLVPSLARIASAVSQDDVLKFLDKINLGKEYRKEFEENYVDGYALYCMTPEDLTAAGLKNPFHRTKIVNGFKAYLQSQL